MTYLIDKAALVAEIEKKRRYHVDLTEYNSGYKNAVIDILSFIDTLEVKEVDLEKESLTWEDIPTILIISEQLKTGWWFADRTKDIGTQAFWEEVLKRFKAQKGK